MAEFNIFLGTARKSVGDVTLLRKAGRQIARVRLRTISNPRSESQAAQRNFVAPVSKFYAPFRKALAQSWEGLSKDDSYNRFQRTNIKLASANGWYLTKGTEFFPLPYQLSSGRLAPFAYYMGEDRQYPALMLDFDSGAPTDSMIGPVSQAFINEGYRAGDIVTILLVMQAEDGHYFPDWGQFRLNLRDTAEISTIFEQDYRINVSGNTIYISGRVYTVVAGAVIISRYSDRRWLRSTQFLAVSADIRTLITSEEQRQATIESYMKGGSDDGGGVYPSPSETAYNVAAMNGQSLLFLDDQATVQIVRVGTSPYVNVVTLKPDNADTYFYVMNDGNEYVSTNLAGSTNPADFSFVQITPPAATVNNTILWSSGSAIDRYLQSIGMMTPS